jgi:hypothetical protein
MAPTLVPYQSLPPLQGVTTKRAPSTPTTANGRAAMRVRLSSPDVERAIGGCNGLAMRQFRLGYAEQSEHGRPMRDAGGVYYGHAWWAKTLATTPKRVEHAFAALRRFGLVVGAWAWRERKQRDGTHVRFYTYVREFAPGVEVVVRDRAATLAVSDDAVALALADLAKRKRWGGARPNAGGSRPNAGRKNQQVRCSSNQQVGGGESASSVQLAKAPSSRAERANVAPLPGVPLGANQQVGCHNKTENKRDLIKAPKELSALRARETLLVGAEHEHPDPCAECFGPTPNAPCDCDKTSTSPGRGRLVLPAGRTLSGSPVPRVADTPDLARPTSESASSASVPVGHAGAPEGVDSGAGRAPLEEQYPILA